MKAPGISVKGEPEVYIAPLKISVSEAEPNLWEATLSENCYIFSHGKSKEEAVGKLILWVAANQDPKYAQIIIED